MESKTWMAGTSPAMTRARHRALCKLVLLAMNPETVYDFEWDPAKALLNARKHDVTFDQAATA